MKVSLLVYKISKWIQTACILDRISFYIPHGSLVALVGPSGSGKSTLLRIIAGLEPSIGGSVWLNGQDCTYTPSQYRKMSFVFQEFALFEHLTVTENISFGLRLRGLNHDEVLIRVEFFLQTLRIVELADYYPYQLSGGQKQRVALARSLAIEPKFVLLDEPFKALDTELRTSIGRWLKGYLKEKNMTALMVTHDHQEALTLADEIIVLNQGRLTQHAKSATVYDAPINAWVGQFLGPLLWGDSLPGRRLRRSYDIQLQRTHSKDTLALVEVVEIRYRRHWIELALLGPNGVPLYIHLGYTSFDRLALSSVNEMLYLRIRS